MARLTCGRIIGVPAPNQQAESRQFGTPHASSAITRSCVVQVKSLLLNVLNERNTFQRRPESAGDTGLRGLSGVYPPSMKGGE
jgi:hypothetical protein